MREEPRFATAAEAGISPDHPAIMRLTQQLRYVGLENLSDTQLRRRRRQAIAGFINHVCNNYGGRDWERRLKEFWRQYGDHDFELSEAAQVPVDQTAYIELRNSTISPPLSGRG